MPLKDVTVTIDLVKPPRLSGFGKPLILVQKEGEGTITNFAEAAPLKILFGAESSVYKKAVAIFAQDNAPAEIAVATYDPASTTDVKTAADAIEKYYESDWYFLLTADLELTDQLAVAQFIENSKFKQYAAIANDAASRNAFKQKAFDRTIPFYHTIEGEEPDAALVGELGSQTVGSITWKHKTLRGITPLDLTKTELNEIHEDNCIAYVTKAGINQTSEGKASSGEYIDIIHGKDWTQANIENNVQTAFSNAKKLPFDTRGISVLKGQVTTALLQAAKNGIIAVDDDGNSLFTVTALSRNQVPAAERANRIYNGLSFSFELAGAIHEANISGEILV